LFLFDILASPQFIKLILIGCQTFSIKNNLNLSSENGEEVREKAVQAGKKGGHFPTILSDIIIIS
jgi:hypothetical protein